MYYCCRHAPVYFRYPFDQIIFQKKGTGTGNIFSKGLLHDL
jgi:hypothetical protein